MRRCRSNAVALVRVTRAMMRAHGSSTGKLPDTRRGRVFSKHGKPLCPQERGISGFCQDKAGEAFPLHAVGAIPAGRGTALSAFMPSRREVHASGAFSGRQPIEALVCRAFWVDCRESTDALLSCGDVRGGVVPGGPPCRRRTSNVVKSDWRPATRPEREVGDGRAGCDLERAYPSMM